ncbi:MAG: hypothetical protein FJZ64_00845 [Chlamydiae bacterium]|nr:hypothetical protein [Chlamydiota bacterium]
MVTRIYSYSLKTTSATWPIRKGLILEINSGFGEIAPLPGFSQETLEEALQETLSLLPNLSSAKPSLPSVQFGIASAKKNLSPIKAPLCLLNDPHPDFSTLKLKLGDLSVQEAITHVQKHLKFRLRLDFNRKWSLDEALSFAKAFSPTDFEYLEEPVSGLDDLVRFSKLTGFPIAVDESLNSPYNQIPTLKALVVKPTVVGEIPKCNVPVVLSSSYETSVGLLAVARLAEENALPLGLDTFRFFTEDLLIPPLKKENGYLTWNPTHEFPIDRSKLCLIKTVS